MARVSEDSDRLVVASIAAELRRILAEAPTLTALRDLKLEKGHLDGLLGSAGLTRSDLPELVIVAISRLDDQVYQAAAQDLFPLPYGDTGWAKLSVRGRLAAERFGISYDGLRKASDGRPSRLDDVLRQVAESLLLTVAANEQRARGDSATAAPWLAEDESQPRSRRFPVAAAAIGTAVLVVVLVAWLSRDSSKPRTSRVAEGSFRPDTCEVAVGLLDEQLAAENPTPGN